jgi:quinol-cytochrome oxidoreductase complex cytochrome b subunit
VNNATLNRFFALHFVLPLNAAPEGNIGVLKFVKLLGKQNNNNTSIL